jgi:Mn-dependent DtxR family transcriptional regulator
LRPGRQKCARNLIHHRLVERFALDIDQMPPREVTREISGLGRLNTTPVPESAATTLQVSTPPLANTARYDSLREADSAEEIRHA